jgi:hypothetical protein
MYVSIIDLLVVIFDGSPPPLTAVVITTRDLLDISFDFLGSAG